MRILIVEDNAFNAFCLSRLFETFNKKILVKTAADSQSALSYLAQYEVSLIILDGNLEANDGLNCDGPALADLIWCQNPQIPIIAWSESERMLAAFAEVFKRHNKQFEDRWWSKKVSLSTLKQVLSSLEGKTIETGTGDLQELMAG